MSGTPTGRAPRSDAEWVRNTEARIRVLEQTPTVRVGSWTLLDQGGSLVAAQPGATPVPLDGSNLDARIADATRSLATGSTVKALDARLNDITSVLGVVGLGTGNPAIPGIENIPLLGPVLAALESLPVIGQVVEAITGVAGQGLAFLTAFFTDLLGILGNPADLGSGNPIIDAVENIPLLGGIIVESVQGLTDLLYNFITGGSGSGNTLDDLRGVIPGVALVPFVGDQIASTVDAVAIGLGRLLGGNFSFGTLSNVARQTANTLDGNVSITETHSLHLAQRAVTKPGFLAIDPTADPTFPIQPGSTPTFLNLTPVAALIGFISIPDPGPKTAVRWCGKTITNITSFVLKLYKLNTATGELTWLHTSANIIEYVAADIDVWNSYTFPTIIPAQGDWYGVEAITSGTGTYQIYGEPYWAPPHASLYPSQLGATRNPYNPMTYVSVGAQWGLAAQAQVIHMSLLRTVTAGDTVFLATVVAGASSSLGSHTAWTRAAHYGGQLMQSIGVVNANNSTVGWLEVFMLKNAPGGEQTVLWDVTGPAQNIPIAQAEIISYHDVGDLLGAPTYNYGNSASVSSGAVASQVGALVLNFFGEVWGGSASAGFTGNYNKTSRFNDKVTQGTNSAALLIGEAAGAASLTFTVTGAACSYAAMSVSFIGAPKPDDDIALPNYSYSPNVPFFALSGVSTTPHHIDKMDYWEVAGTVRFTPYEWATTADLVGVGAGGGGGAGQYGGGTDGTATVFTVHYSDATPDLTVTAPGGAGGPSGWIMYDNTHVWGLGPGTQTYNGEEYFGGGVVGAWGTGDSPGGGGGGGEVQVLLSWEYGNGGFPGEWGYHLNLPLANVEYIDVTVGTHGETGPTTPGGPGADGGAWIRSYQA